MSGLVLRGLALLVALASCSACTVVTSCPTGQPSGNNTGNGGSGNTGNGGAGSTIAGNGGMAPDGEWINATSNLADLPSECGNLGLVSAKPDEDLLIVGVARSGLFSSSDGGDSWAQLGDSDAIINRISTIVYDPADPNTFWESGTYNGDGVYQTTDDGAHFVSQGIAHIDYLSVDFTDPARKLLLAGGHEQPKTVYRSTDGGKKWDLIGMGLPADTYCNLPLLLDENTYVVGCYGGKNAVYRTEDAGVTWDSVADAGGGAAPLLAQDGTIYWPGGAKSGFVRSTDGGKTWSDVLGGDFITNVPFVELPDHRIAAVGREAVMVTSDDGDTWQAVTSKLPFAPYSLTYSTQRKAFYISYFTCGNSPVLVPENAIMRYDFE